MRRPDDISGISYDDLWQRSRRERAVLAKAAREKASADDVREAAMNLAKTLGEMGKIAEDKFCLFPHLAASDHLDAASAYSQGGDDTSAAAHAKKSYDLAEMSHMAGGDIAPRAAAIMAKIPGYH